MIDVNGFTEKSLWGSKASQEIRFKTLTLLFAESRNFSVLDLGCGLCDFYNYLINAGYSDFEYTGLEINERFYNEVRNKKLPVDIIHGSIESLSENKNFDYVVASGIYNLGNSADESEKFFLDQFKTLYPRIRKGFAVNFLSAFSKNKDKVSTYHEPLRLLSLCMSEFSEKVVLYHNYLPHDFTILVYK